VNRRVPSGILAGFLALALSGALATTTATAIAASAQTVTPTSISIQDWIGRLQNASTAAAQGEVAPSPETMNGVRDSLGLPVTISTPSGMTTIASDQFLDGLSGGATKDFVAAKDHLDQLVTSAEEADASVPLDRAAIQEHLNSVYEQVHPRSGGLWDFISDLRRAAGDLLARILSGLFSNKGPVTVFGWTLVVIALAVVFLIVRRVQRSIVPHRSRNEDRGRELERVDWRALAAAARAKGDSREAARCLYHAMLEDFAIAGVVGDDPALTAGELRRSVGRERPEFYQGVSRATRTFERAHFGKSDPPDADIDHMAETERQIRP
jgi:hypothetical protein